MVGLIACPRDLHSAEEATGNPGKGACNEAPHHLVHGFEGKGGKYLVLETVSTSEARDLYHARVVSGFRTAISSIDGDLTVEELDRIADLEDRYA